MKKSPYKLTVAALFLEQQSMFAEEVHKKLLPEYAGNVLGTMPHVERALQSLRAVGILQHTQTDDGSVSFALTGHGRRKVIQNLPSA